MRTLVSENDIVAHALVVEDVVVDDPYGAALFALEGTSSGRKWADCFDASLIGTFDHNFSVVLVVEFRRRHYPWISGRRQLDLDGHPFVLPRSPRMEHCWSKMLSRKWWQYRFSQRVRKNGFCVCKIFGRRFIRPALSRPALSTYVVGLSVRCPRCQEQRSGTGQE